MKPIRKERQTHETVAKIWDDLNGLKTADIMSKFRTESNQLRRGNFFNKKMQQGRPNNKFIHGAKSSLSIRFAITLVKPIYCFFLAVHRDKDNSELITGS